MKKEYAFDLSKVPISKPSTFLRWAGGKRALLKTLLSFIPTKVNNYYEPFIGGGALYFALSPNGNMSTISDTNAELINCYMQVASNPEKIIKSLSTFSFDDKCYYATRKHIPENDLDRASRFIYLNRTCWNGLYRVNKKGEFNVPIGKFTNEPTICPENKIRESSKILSKTKIVCDDFEKVVENSGKSDFVYFDPPYTVKHDKNGFRQYNEKVFSWDDQERLAQVSEDLKRRGVKIMISNAANKDIMELYENFYMYKVSRCSVISGTSSSRGRVNELIITSYEIPNNVPISENVEVL